MKFWHQTKYPILYAIPGFEFNLIYHIRKYNVLFQTGGPHNLTLKYVLLHTIYFTPLFRAFKLDCMYTEDCLNNSLQYRLFLNKAANHQRTIKTCFTIFYINTLTTIQYQKSTLPSYGTPRITDFLCVDYSRWLIEFC